MGAPKAIFLTPAILRASDGVKWVFLPGIPAGVGNGPFFQSFPRALGMALSTTASCGHLRASGMALSSRASRRRREWPFLPESPAGVGNGPFFLGLPRMSGMALSGLPWCSGLAPGSQPGSTRFDSPLAYFLKNHELSAG